MARHLATFLLLAIFLACMAGNGRVPYPAGTGLSAAPDSGRTIADRFAPPEGTVRVPVQHGSFGAYLRTLHLKAAGSAVHLFDGSEKYRQDVHAAVVDLSVGTRDLQQCADAVMRLRAEHLFAQDRYDDIHFNFTNGFRAEYQRWANGERIQVRGNECLWKGEGRTGHTQENLMSFLEKVFSYAGTLSLSKELKDAHTLPIEPGDVFVHGGSPGHAMIVVDVARGNDGRTYFVLAQSYMPAQEIHVVRNQLRSELGAWFEQDDGRALVTPEWSFSWGERKRW